MNVVAITGSRLPPLPLTESGGFAKMFDDHARTIYLFAWRRVGADASNDVTAETFRVAFERREDFDDSLGNVLPWLFGIATNVIRSYRRVERRQLRVASIDRETFDMTNESDDRLDAARVRPALTRALSGLSPEDRDTLLLFAWTDLGYHGVAQALNIPAGTVGSRLTRARRTMRRELEAAGWQLDEEETLP